MPGKRITISVARITLSRQQTCSMACDVLSLNVNSGKADDLRYFWELHLIVHVIMFYMTGDFFDEMIWSPCKSAKIHSDPGSRAPQDLQNLGRFSQNFDLVRDRIESDVKGGYKRHKPQRKKPFISLILARIWNQRKRWYNPGTCPMWIILCED